MIWSIAWRNVWRNKTRSMVVVLAIATGLYGCVFMIALTKGLMKQKVDAVINYEISDIQLHDPGFLEDESVLYNIGDYDSIKGILNELPAILAWCPRVKATGMISTAHAGNGVMINGIIPEKEKTVTRISQTLDTGSYFTTRSRIPSILISRKLAGELHAGAGKKVVLTTTALSGETAQALFRIEGIYKTSNELFDEMNVFVMAGDLLGMVSPDSAIVTEIAIRVGQDSDTTAATVPLREAFPGERLSVRSWKDLEPTLLAMVAMMNQFSYILVLIILLALAFGIVNTMLMVIMERIHELGMLMAIGMNRRRVFLMIMLETVFMSVTGALAGILISALTIALTARRGINFAAWAEGMESMGYSAHVYPFVENSFYIYIGIMVIMAAMLASLWPARKALKLQPADAIREEM
jgi:ABC-type lipoprotein release transport system permease subunit